MKKILGIVVEFNPLHNGHLYFIEEAKRQINPDITIAVMSSSFTMRGDIMVIDKFSRTKFMLEAGIDLVVELPFISAVQSADFFAYNAISILNSFGITHLAFGAELANTTKLKKLAKLTTSKPFDEKLRFFLNKGFSYPVSSIKSLSNLIDDTDLIKNFHLPNNTLAIGYLKAIEQINSNIIPMAIKRIAAQYFEKDISDESIASATAIRKLILENKDIQKYVPESILDYPFIDVSAASDKLLLILKYIFNQTTQADFSNILGVNEGIENRINNLIDDSKEWSQLISILETKRYSRNRIKRTLLHIIINTPKSFENEFVYYLRILGMNTKGRRYIGSLSRDIKNKIITSYKNHQNNAIIEIEKKVTKLYGLITNQEKLINAEYRVPIIIK